MFIINRNINSTKGKYFKILFQILLNMEFRNHMKISLVLLTLLLIANPIDCRPRDFNPRAGPVLLYTAGRSSGANEVLLQQQRS